MLHEYPKFWYTVALVIFILFTFRYARKPLLNWLDAEIGKIGGELERARQLRAEAEAALAEYKKKHADAMGEAEMIVRHAKEEAERLKVQAAADLRDSLARHEQQVAERIRLAEAEALAAVRAAAVDEAMNIARKNLADAANGSLADQAIAELPKLVTKSKAA